MPLSFKLSPFTALVAEERLLNYLTLFKLGYFVIIKTYRGAHLRPPPPSVSPLFVVQLPSNLAGQVSETKSLKDRKSRSHNDVTMTSMMSYLL